MSKTYTERIATIEEQITQLENRRKQLKQQQSKQERKLRTKRLIDRGSFLEYLVPELKELSNEQVQAFLERTVTTGFAAKTLESVKAQPSVTMDEKTRDLAGVEG